MRPPNTARPAHPLKYNDLEGRCRPAGIVDLYFRDPQREAGSRWLHGGVPLLTVRNWRGHSNISQTTTHLETT